MSTSTDNSRSSAYQLSDWHVKLRRILVDYFDENDIETLCFDLRIDSQSLSGDSKTRKIIELIRFLARTGRVGELIDYCSKQRPNVPWTELREAAISNPLIVEHEPDRESFGDTLNRPRIEPTPSFSSKSLNFALVIITIAGVVAVISLIVPKLISTQATSPTVTPFIGTRAPVLMYRVITDNAYVYLRPDINSERIETITKGQLVKFSGFDGNWVMVTYIIGSVETKGWVQQDALEIVK